MLRGRLNVCVRGPSICVWRQGKSVQAWWHVEGRVNVFVFINVTKISACRQGESTCWRPDNVGIICLDSM